MPSSEHGHIIFCIRIFQTLLSRYLNNGFNTLVQSTRTSTSVPESLRREGISEGRWVQPSSQSVFEHCQGQRYSGQPIPVCNYLHSRYFSFLLPTVSCFSLGPLSLILLCTSGITLALSYWQPPHRFWKIAVRTPKAFCSWVSAPPWALPPHLQD